MKIGILTGGGDVPGLNPCIKALVYRAIDEGHEVLGIRRGWGGVLNYNPALSLKENALNAIPLDKNAVRTVDRFGGTFLHTSRTNPSNVKAKEVPAFLKKPDIEAEKFDMTEHALKVVEAMGIDVLVPIGGDDTQSYSERLHREGVPVVAIPKTMDNDVFGT
ncbi:MAG TPA: 6-phosphofructokinase, partial [Deltaproteobacteria bacterium]|nr:6-phosphofructokinase [Deltaproteobacteria bacterium]